MSARRGRSNGGWTLSEVMISVAIVGVISLVGPPIMIQMQRFYLQSDARTTIQRDARASLDQINRFLRQGQANSIVIDNASGQPPYSRITFSTIDGATHVVYQNGRALMHKNGSTLSTLSNYLSFIAFTFPRTDDSTIVSVSMTMEKSTFQGGYKALELTIQKVRVMN